MVTHSNDALLQVKELSISFKQDAENIAVVKQISFDVQLFYFLSQLLI
jgi:ABC-type microcin C transport system duplicated ATPase subunit YejF